MGTDEIAPAVRFPFAAAVLAGGRSSRMGTDKAHVQWHGRPLIEHQLATLRALGPAELLISARPGAVHAIANARLVFDRTPDQGPLGGIAAVLAATATPLVLVLAVDLPAMSAEFLCRLLEASVPRRGVVPHGLRGWEPLAAVYPREILPLVQERLARRELALQPLVRAAVQQGLLLSREVSDAERERFQNINTPADLPRAQPGGSR